MKTKLPELPTQKEMQERELLEILYYTKGREDMLSEIQEHFQNIDGTEPLSKNSPKEAVLSELKKFK